MKLDDFIKAKENEHKLVRSSLIKNNKNSEKVARVLQNLRGIIDSDNLFTKLYSRGDGMTFDS